MLSQAPNERGQVGQMSGRDLHGGGQVLEAIRLDGPRRVIGEDVADPGLLGTGEHGAAMVAEGAEVGQPPPRLLAESPEDLYEIGNVRSAYGRRPVTWSRLSGTAESGRSAMVTVGAAPPLWLSA
jgi:hypothetical protein